MRKGFTLVELSIVLVIVGLLIGGILVAQSMTSTTTVTKQVSQIQEFDAAVMSFKSLYKHLPGDAPTFGGDGDGLIETSPSPGLPYDLTTPNITKAFGCEIARFWSSAIPGQFQQTPGSCNSPFVAKITTGSTKNVPVSIMGPPDSFFIASAYSSDGNVADTTTPENYYALLHGSQLSTQVGGSWQFAPTSLAAGNYPLTAAEMLALDKKMDNGTSNTGIVISGRIPNNTGAGGIMKDSNPATNCDASGVYNLTYTDRRCTPLIRIGGAAGDGQ